MQQGVAPAGRNRTGPPCSVGRPTVHAPGRRCADRPRVRQPAGPPVRDVTDDRRKRAKLYWPRDNLKHFYLSNLSHHFKLLSHICVPCPRSYLAYGTLISMFYYYYYYYIRRVSNKLTGINYFPKFAHIKLVNCNAGQL